MRLMRHPRCHRNPQKDWQGTEGRRCHVANLRCAKNETRHCQPPGPVVYGYNTAAIFAASTRSFGSTSGDRITDCRNSMGVIGAAANACSLKMVLRFFEPRGRAHLDTP